MMMKILNDKKQWLEFLRYEHKNEIKIMSVNNEERHYSKINNELLISPSRVNQLFKAPPPIKRENLAKAIDFGKQVGLDLFKYFIENNKNFKGTKQYLDMLESIIHTLKGLNWEPVYFEKHLNFNGLHGYIDICCWDNNNNEPLIIELKTRTKKNVRINKEIEFQTYLYKYLVENRLNHKVKAYALIVDRNNETEPKIYEVKESTIFNCFLALKNEYK